MDAIEKVRVERVATQTAIADLRSQLAVLEDKEKRLAITEATLAELMGMPNAPDVFSGERGSVKRMVLAEFSPGMILTKMDVVSRLSIKGIQVNEGTVGSTLSKAIGVTSHHNPASRSRHIPATWRAIAGHLEAG